MRGTSMTTTVFYPAPSAITNAAFETARGAKGFRALVLANGGCYHAAMPGHALERVCAVCGKAAHGIGHLFYGDATTAAAVQAAGFSVEVFDGDCRGDAARAYRRVGGVAFWRAERDPRMEVV